LTGGPWTNYLKGPVPHFEFTEEFIFIKVLTKITIKHKTMMKCEVKSNFIIKAKLSVRLSATCRYSVKTLTHILNIFSTSGSHAILVFAYRIFRQEPPNRGVECKGVEKRPNTRFSRLRHYSTLSISETVRDTDIVIMNY